MRRSVLFCRSTGILDMSIQLIDSASRPSFQARLTTLAMLPVEGKPVGVSVFFRLVSTPAPPCSSTSAHLRFPEHIVSLHLVSAVELRGGNDVL